MTHAFVNPSNYLVFFQRSKAIFWVLTIGLLVTGMYYALIASPEDYQQGNAVRMMYVHVPAAWMALGVYVFMALSSMAGYIWKHPLSFISAAQAAPLGAGFTAICLITGSLWGKPMWGTWWVWDARLTSVLVLFFLYIGYMLVYHSFSHAEKGAQIAGLLLLLGLINIPIIKFSVEWWNTLHQPASIMRTEGIAIDGSMLFPLLLMFGAFIGWFVMILVMRIETATMQRKLFRKLQLR